MEKHYQDLERLLHSMGEAGRHIARIGASEGAAGNLSVYLGRLADPRGCFPEEEEIELPLSVPELAGGFVLVTGSGRRLREIIDDPAASVACVAIRGDGRTGSVFTSPRRRFERPTSEFNSHLAVHADRVRSSGTDFHAVIHAQPVHLTFLSHVPRYRDQRFLNERLMRWQAETIIQLPEGIGYIPFRVPGSRELMEGNIGALRRHRVVIWEKHGVMARSDDSIRRAADLVEYAETAARYEYLNLAAGEEGEGLSRDEILNVCRSFNVVQHII